jgi:hypothetical protein
MADEFFLSRWSRLKSRARQDEAPPPEAPLEGVPAEQALLQPAGATPGEGTAAETAPESQPLPAVESLTADSDFTPFMKADVDPNLRRQALRTLFRDPRFNVMDGLDVYIDDFSKPDPIPPEWLGQLTQMARLGLYQEPEPEPEEGKEAGADAVAAVAPETAPAGAADTPAATDAASEVVDCPPSASLNAEFSGVNSAHKNTKSAP